MRDYLHSEQGSLYSIMPYLIHVWEYYANNIDKGSRLWASGANETQICSTETIKKIWESPLRQRTFRTHVRI